jgi:hypothetical protein
MAGFRCGNRARTGHLIALGSNALDIGWSRLGLPAIASLKQIAPCLIEGGLGSFVACGSKRVKGTADDPVAGSDEDAW